MTRGIEISATGSPDQPIALTASAVTAFVGRTLRGPVNVPVPIASLADFQQVFGGLWQPSPLSYAVEQFFDHGGRQALIVRIVNGAVPPTLSLPCGRDVLTLVALAPGSREFLRAAVDYDNIGSHEADRFNLVIQRLRSPGSERIDAQEIFRGVSASPAATRFISTILSESQLVRVRGRVPAARPDATSSPGVRTPATQAFGYVGSNPDGNDGGPLTDYDIIGSSQDSTGLFALHAAPHFDFLYLPPLSRSDDLVVSTLVVATRYCRSRHALLIVDPPAHWQSADDAIHGLRQLSFLSVDACMFFPRVLGHDRLRGSPQVFGSGGAVAGMLARAAEQRAVWDLGAQEPELLLRPGTRLACDLSESDRWRLSAHGINPLQLIRTAGPVRLVPRTLAGGANAASDWSYIGPRRFALFVLNRIERSTRWVVMQPAERAAWHRVRRQVLNFLHELAGAGAFPGAVPGQAYFVIVDERINAEHETAAGMVSILVGFAASRPGELHSYLITHGATGSTVRAVAVNPLESFWSPAPVETPDPHTAHAIPVLATRAILDGAG